MRAIYWTSKHSTLYMFLVYCILKLKCMFLTLRQENINQPFSMVPENIYTILDSLIHILAFCKHVFSISWQSSDITLDETDKTAGPCNYNTPHTGEKRNKWLRGFVTMISLSAWGNYVTMEMYFPWVKVQNNEVGKSGCMLGMATYCTERKQRKKRRTRRIPCNPLTALFTYIERRWLVPQGNRKSWIYTHLQHKARECWLLSMINSDANAT